MRTEAQRVESWLRMLEDSSGIEGEWQENPETSDTVKDLLVLAGKTYLPFLQANAVAAKAGDESFSLEILGHPYSQGTFRYQVKCLKDLQTRYQALSPDNKARADSVLEATGCLEFLSHKGEEA